MDTSISSSRASMPYIYSRFDEVTWAERVLTIAGHPLIQKYGLGPFFVVGLLDKWEGFCLCEILRPGQFPYHSSDCPGALVDKEPVVSLLMPSGAVVGIPGALVQPVFVRAAVSH